MTMEKEIMPIGVNIFVQPYPENPYRKNKTETGFQLSDGEFHNPDSGELEYLEQNIICGYVLEVGKDCKQVRAGDDVFFQKHMSTSIPFLGKGFMLTHEPGLLCIIGEGLKDRLINGK